MTVSALLEAIQTPRGAPLQGTASSARATPPQLREALSTPPAPATTVSLSAIAEHAHTRVCPHGLCACDLQCLSHSPPCSPFASRVARLHRSSRGPVHGVLRGGVQGSGLSAACKPCAAGSYALAGSASCTQCPAGPAPLQHSLLHFRPSCASLLADPACSLPAPPLADRCLCVWCRRDVAGGQQ
eukprot:590290-Rhodomonas_salina.2